MPLEAVGTRRVLVVDDHGDVLEAMRLLLKGAAYASDLADSPEAALARAQETDYDLIVIDMNYARDTTSGEEGLALLDRLHAARPQTPIIVMTAWSTIELAVIAMQRGARDFITKPWQNDRVLELVAKHAVRQSEADDPMTIARRVQQRFLPPAKFRSPAIECDCVWRPAGEIGGDLCDILSLDDNRAAFALGDVSGKGVASGLMMASLHAAVRSHYNLAARPAALAAAVNRVFRESTGPEHFATAFFGVYERPAKAIRYVNCGHTAGLLCRADGSVQRLKSTATVLGLFYSPDFVETAVEVRCGDRLVLFSDGLSDSQPNGDDEWIARSAAMLARANSHSIAEALAAAAANGRGDIDDITIMDVRFL